MAYCTACGTEVAVEVRFCPSCGVADPTGRSPVTGELRSVTGLTSGLVWLMGIFAAGCALAAALLLAERGAIDDVESAGTFANLIDLDEAISNTTAAVVGLGLLAIAIFVVLIIWTHRAYTNLPKLGVGPLRLGTGMAVGSWFIPFYNLGGPKQIINDIWRGSDRHAVGDPNWARRPILGLSTVWWIVFAVGYTFALGGTIAGHQTDEDFDDPVFWIAANTSDALSANAAAIVGYLVAGVGAAIGAVAVKRIGERHTDMCAGHLLEPADQSENSSASGGS